MTVRVPASELPQEPNADDFQGLWLEYQAAFARAEKAEAEIERLRGVESAARRFLELHDANVGQVGSAQPTLGIPQLRDALSATEGGNG